MPSATNNHHHSTTTNSNLKKKKKKPVLKHRHRLQDRKKNSRSALQNHRKPENWIATNNTPFNKSDTPAINASTPPVIDQVLNDETTEEEDGDIDEPLSSMVSAESFTSQAAFSPLEDGGVHTISNGNTNASKIAQIAAPIISIFGGIALVTVALFFVSKKRKRNSVQVKSSKPEDQDHGKMHDIPLTDEAILFSDSHPPPPSSKEYAENLTFPNTPFHYHQQDANYQHHFESPSVNEYYMRTNRESIYYNSLDYYQSSMMSDTLIESHITTRSNSTNTKKTTRSFVSKPIDTTSSSSPRSSCSSVYTDALVSPTSTVIGPHLSSFLMIAERQQLQHERPNILDHFHESSSRSTPIQTYKAQLSDIVDLGADDIPDIEPSTLPFYPVIDLSNIDH